MRSESIERAKQWIEGLKHVLLTPVKDVSFIRMTTFDNIGFDRARELAKNRAASCFEGSSRDKSWGRKWEYGWFYGTLKLDESMRGRRIELIPDVGGEMLVEINGELRGSRDLKHDYITLTRDARGDEEYEILIESYAGHGPRLEHAGPAFYGVPTVPEPPTHQVKEGRPCIAVFNESAYQLYIDAVTLMQLYETLDPDSLRAEKILKGLFEFTRIADFEVEPALRDASFDRAREVLKPLLRCVNGSTAPMFSIFGQSHLDLAWKWTYEETRRKCARTYSTQLALMEEYPEYRFFGCSPFIFETMKRDYPALFERVRKLVRRNGQSLSDDRGQITADGGMYVESDCNIPSGESLIRQIMWAKKWYRENLDTDTRLLWLPDCFGFPGQLPQILKGCGIDYFSTQKLFRARKGCQKFPYNNFYWDGIDGSSILTHFHKKNNARLEVSQLVQRWNEDRVQHEDIDSMMFPFGYGDGGGGATRDMLETARRVGDLEGCPRTEWRDPVSFMDELAAKGDIRNRYRGELYLPWHRGTYTSQAKIKKLNRRAEDALRKADMWCAIAVGQAVSSKSTAEGRASELRGDFEKRLHSLWERMLFLQFHDILPGTSIERVNREAEEGFEKVIEGASELAGEAQKYVISADLSETAPRAVWNSLGHSRACASGTAVPSIGYAAAARSAASDQNGSAVSCTEEKSGDFLLANGRVKARIDRSGRLVSYISDGVELMAAPGNVLRLYRDINVEYDAWELATYYKDEEISDIAEDPLGKDGSAVTGHGIGEDALGGYAYIDVERKILDSAVSQRIILRENSDRIEFSTAVDWRETHKLLRVDFPVDINTDELLCETQYGIAKRPNHRSKQSDRDMFEGCCHRFEMLAEGRRFAAILNDSKYGCGAEGNVMSLTLLKSAKIPDMTADMGLQEFTYAFLGGAGCCGQMRAVREAEELNSSVDIDPSFVFPAEFRSRSFFGTDGDLIIDEVKLPEDGSDSIVVRVYEPLGEHVSCRLFTAFDVSEAARCDMLENTVGELDTEKNGKSGGTVLKLELKPYEIVTLKLYIG